MARLSALLLILLSTLPGRPAAAQDRPENLQLRDRIVAVVDEDPILDSDIDRAIALGLVTREDGEAEESYRRRVLEALIDHSVRFHEVTRFGIEQVPVHQIEEQVALIRSRFADDEEFSRQLETVGLDLATLRQLVARQLRVWTYFEEFLGPRIFVSLDDVRAYYDETLVPELEARGQPAPPIEKVREEIRAVLKERRLNAAITTRTEELRREADIVNYFDGSSAELPPVILEIGEEGAALSRPHP